MTPFAELVAATNFSFLRGASHASEIVRRAKELGLAAIAVADRNTLAGVVRAHTAAKEEGIRCLAGARLVTTCSFEVIAYPKDRAAYGRLTRLLTAGNRRAKKGCCHLSFDEVQAAGAGQIFILLPPSVLDAEFREKASRIAAVARGRTYLAASHHYRGDEVLRLAALAELAGQIGAPLLATNDVLYHEPQRRPLADVLACIREKCSIAEAGFRLEANAERHLKSADEMARLFAHYPDAVRRPLDILREVTFSLDELSYEYPDEPVPIGKTAQQHLSDLTAAHLEERYPAGVPAPIAALIEKELELIRALDYARYFLTVYDIVRFARERGILCQGRGSAANSAVCYALGITAVDPTKIDLLFERFISIERRELPDIDVDFEHERREEVIQYLYARYGRERAAICSTVIHYRSRMAIRDVGRALGLKDDVTGALADTVWGSGGDGIPDSHIRQAGFDPANPAIRQAIELAAMLTGFPRHLSQHVGGFVLTRQRLDETVPILNGAMVDRTFIEWDKDDIDALGILKVDVLALGMLTAIRKSFDLVRRAYGRSLSLACVPQDDADVYAMLSRADSVGVFQVESRAQMSMLPRLQPRQFYDLVIEVAIVRPGPIQGDMVHPYLRRRAGLEPIEFPSEELREVLGKTCGVPLFQEQAMRIAIVAAGFSPGEADKLRRAMATFRHTGTIYSFREKFVTGMVSRGYQQEFAERCFNQIEGFGEYGFPESHAASFALLVYVSAWLKHHYPEAFCAGLINSQPMGFYQPAQLVRDAREHDVEVRAADVNRSEWECTLEIPSPRDRGERARPNPLPVAPATGRGDRRAAVRLGLRLVSGLSEAEGQAIVAARRGGFTSVRALWAASGTGIATIEKLADADAFRSMGLDRRAALWEVRGLGQGAASVSRDAPLLAGREQHDLFAEPSVSLPEMPASEHVAEDYTATGLSLKAHPVHFFREDLKRQLVITSAEHWDDRFKGRLVSVAGLVLVRQRPGTAKGVVFLTIEDETGIVNIVVWRKVFERWRRLIMTAQFVIVRGRLERDGLVSHVVAHDFIDLTARLTELADGTVSLPHLNRDAGEGSWKQRSRDFH
ncbi:MAG: error-prone DNA polymerase [Hyphomicrobium sp.]|jgi:error-prone DNA polymerase